MSETIETDLKPSKLREIRKRKGLTQEELAKQLDVSPVTISRYENLPKRLDLPLMRKIARILGSSVAELAGETANETSEGAKDHRGGFDEDRERLLHAHHVTMIDTLIATGRYACADDVIREGLRLVEEREAKHSALLNRLDRAYSAGLASGSADTLETADELIAEFNAKRRNAKG